MIVNNGLVTIPPQVSCGKTLQVFTHIYKITRGLVTIPPQVSCGKTLQTQRRANYVKYVKRNLENMLEDQHFEKYVQLWHLATLD